MTLTIELSKVVENKEKKQLRFSFKLSVNSIPLLVITGMRIKNGKLFFPSYISGGTHKALIFAFPSLLDNLRKMLQDDIGYYYSDYAAHVDTEHCSPKSNDIATLLGERTITKEFTI